MADIIFGANGKNGEVGMEGDDGYRLGSKGNLEKSAVFANYGERLRSGLYSISAAGLTASYKTHLTTIQPKKGREFPSDV